MRASDQTRQVRCGAAARLLRVWQGGFVAAGIATLLLLGPVAGSPARAASDAVTEWTLLADRFGQGYPNWRTLAIMHMAMHDAWNAARPTYARWAQPLPGEPAGNGASPLAAMAAAAHAVLVRLHPAPVLRREADALLVRVLGRDAGEAGQDAGIALGEAVGAAAVMARARDGWERAYPFPASELPGHWRPTPPTMATGKTTKSRPYLFATVAEGLAVARPPPELGSPAYLRDLDEVRHMGVAGGSGRTPDQTAAAVFWAYQSSQRGFIRLGVDLLDDYPRRGGLAAHARAMSQLAAALADSAVLVWAAKERYAFWRPITAIRATGQASDAEWEPLVETPAFPEYMSGHAADCFVGAGVLRAVFPDVREPIVYVGPGADDLGVDPAAADVGALSMGQHLQGNRPARSMRGFAGLEVAARECSESRIWSGAHFRFSDIEAERLAEAIVRRAASAVPPLRR